MALLISTQCTCCFGNTNVGFTQFNNVVSKASIHFETVSKVNISAQLKWNNGTLEIVLKEMVWCFGCIAARLGEQTERSCF